jgi:hypothetical protein
MFIVIDARLKINFLCICDVWIVKVEASGYMSNMLKGLYRKHITYKIHLAR